MEESMNRSLRRPAPGSTLTKETDEELALFIEMRKLEKERRDLRLHSTGELDPPLGNAHSLGFTSTLAIIDQFLIEITC